MAPVFKFNCTGRKSYQVSYNLQIDVVLLVLLEHDLGLKLPLTDVFRVDGSQFGVKIDYGDLQVEFNMKRK